MPVMGVLSGCILMRSSFLERFALVNAVTISVTGQSIPVILMQFVNGLRVLVAFMAHVIAKACVIVDGSSCNYRGRGKNIIFFVGVDVCRLVAAHRWPFLTLAPYERRISWGLDTYFHKGSDVVPSD